MGQLVKWLYFVLGTRLHVGVLYFFVTTKIIESFSAPSDATSWVPIAAFSIWNFSLYLFDRVHDAAVDYQSSPSEAIPKFWRMPLFTLCLILPFSPVILLYDYQLPVWPYLCFIPLTFLYNLPVFPKHRAVKHFPLVKNLYSSVVIWNLPIAVILSIYLPPHLPIWKTMFMLWSNIALITLAEIIWDMRDVHADAQHNIRTLPVILGLQPVRFWLVMVIWLIVAPAGWLTGQLQPALLGWFTFAVLVTGPHLPKLIFHLPILLALVSEYLHYRAIR